MAVPIEFCTAILRKDELTANFPGGLDALFAFCDSATWLEDDHLVRISFMATSEALALVDRIADRVATVSAEPLISAIVDHSVTPGDLPPWLSVGEVAGTHCAWLAGSSPGPVAAVPRCFSARFFRVPFGSFIERIAALGISVESALPMTTDVVFRRGSTRVEAAVGIDDPGTLFGMLTFPPRSRSADVTRHEQLLADLESTLRNLGWNGSA